MTFARIAKAGLAAAIIALAAGPALAQETARDAFDRAMASYAERVGSVETGPAIDTTDVAANAADLAVIEQALDQLGTPAFPVDGFATFESVCERLNRLSVRHSLDGLSAMARPAGAPPLTPDETRVMMGKVQALQMRNVARYPDQITVLSGGGMRCMIKHFPALLAMLDGLPPAELTPIRLKGAAGIRQGGSQALIGFLISLRDPATSPANRARITSYLREIADPLAAAMTPAMRADFTATLDRLPPSPVAEAQATTDLIKAAMATTTCEGLCRY